MKIIFFVDNLKIGGVTLFLKWLSDDLKREGHEAIFVGDNSGQVKLNHKIYDIKNLGVPYKFPKVKLLMKITKEENPDVAILNNVKNAYAINKISKNIPTIPYFLDVSFSCYGGVRFWHRSLNFCKKKHNIFCYYYAYKERCSFKNPIRFLITYISKYFEINAYKKMKAIFVISRDIKELLVQNGIPKEKIHLIFPCAKNLLNTLNTKIPKASYIIRNKTILYFGRITALKGIYELVEIFKLLRNQTFKLFVYGIGPDTENLKKFIRDKGLEEKIILKGYFLDEEKNSILSRARVFIMPSLWREGFGMVGVEAMANRLPIVAYDVGGIRDWLYDGENGFLISYKDKAEMAKKVDILINDTKLAEKMGDRGYEIFKEKFSGEKTVLDFINVCQDLKKV